MLYYLIAILLIQASLAERTNFTYDQHGADWTGNCKTGKKQSPVLLDSKAVPTESYLFGAYKNINATVAFYNTTTYINAAFGQLFTMTVLGKAVPFRATEVRLRCESEHVIHFDNDENFTRFPLQLQIFHMLIEPQSTNDKLAIAIHYQIGQTVDPVIQSIIDAQVNNSTHINIDFSYYVKRGNTYNFWMYQGSPTIPECNDGTMNWLIIDKRFSITQEQADYFKKQFYDGPKQKSGNYRDLQHTESQIGYYSFTSE